MKTGTTNKHRRILKKALLGSQRARKRMDELATYKIQKKARLKTLTNENA